MRRPGGAARWPGDRAVAADHPDPALPLRGRSPFGLDRPYAVGPATFRRHLDAVAATGDTTLTVSGMLAALAAGRLPERPVLVTFDDGYRDTLTAAAPALAERGMTSKVYVTTGVVGEKSPDAQLARGR